MRFTYSIILCSLVLFAGCKKNESKTSPSTPDFSWEEVGTASLIESANHIVTFDASGNLYATAHRYVLKWDKTSEAWKQLGTLKTDGEITRIVADSKGNVYVAGNNLFLNGATIAKWNGQNWDSLSTNGGDWKIGTADAMTTDFNGNLVTNIVHGKPTWIAIGKYTGASWDYIYDPPTSTEFGGMAMFTGMVSDKNGKIYVVVGNGIAKWDGAYWSNIPLWNDASGIPKWIMIDSNGKIYVSTNTDRELKVLDGTTWATMGGLNNNDYITAMTTDISGGVYIAGKFNNKNSVLKWDGTKWSEIGNLNANNRIRSLACDLEDGGYIYASGEFRNGNSKTYVARYKK